MPAAALRHDAETVADLDALDRVDAHHRPGDVGVELVEQRLTQSDRHASGAQLDARTAGVTSAAQLVHVRLELRHDAGIG